MENMKEIITGRIKDQLIERNAAKQYIEAELGDSITNMTFEDIAEVVQEGFEIDVETLADILETDLSLDFSDDQTYKYMLNIQECSSCHKEFKRSDMAFTKDCHGIPFRLVCHSCHEKAMVKGYDGEYYTEADEQIDEDY